MWALASRFMIIPNTKRHPNNTKTDQLPISEVITGLPRPYHNTMSWMLEYFVAYLSSVYFSMFGWLCRATYCSVVSTSMLGVSHAVQNEEKL